MHDPHEPHFNALKRILRYVRGTVDCGLELHVSSTAQLTAYTDADWAGCPVARRSTSEVEYRGVANVVAEETAWIRNLLRELHTPLFTTTIVYCDNVRVLHVPSRFFKKTRQSGDEYWDDSMKAYKVYPSDQDSAGRWADPRIDRKASDYIHDRTNKWNSIEIYHR
ncbi:ribonuclease H-like domain-containing protein [Tanacetum coccineum]|uniref:Ribonuclease H-like domain-containing protein n=1 Tax=Tanacetum coccineum TaxID=301880 RepID=A0ABQ5DL50_9ASTR